MSLREQMALNAEAIFNTSEFAEEVIITPDDGLPVTVIVIISEGADYGRVQGGGSMVSAQGFMRVKRADFPDDKPKGTVTRGNGAVWVIGQELSSNLMTRKVEIKARPRAAFRG